MDEVDLVWRTEHITGIINLVHAQQDSESQKYTCDARRKQRKLSEDVTFVFSEHHVHDAYDSVSGQLTMEVA